jgi:hypothetical protein
MPLHIQNGFCPIVLCDHCAEPIADAAASGALWLESSAAKPGRHRIYFIHDACHSAFEQTAFTEAERSRVVRTDLADFLTHLSANAGVASEPQIKAQLLERISSRLAKPKLHNPIPSNAHESPVR